jgi:hypothetical protein
VSSTQKDILDAISTAINAIGLSNLEAVRIRTSARDRGRIEPGITLSIVPEREYTGTNEYEHIGHGVLVAMAINSNDTDEDDILAQWRQAIRRTFNHQRLSGVSDVCVCRVEPGGIYTNQYRAAQRDMDLDFLTIRAIAQETRL